MRPVACRLNPRKQTSVRQERPIVLLTFERDALWGFDFGLVIGISFSSAAFIAATTEAPSRHQPTGQDPSGITAPWNKYSNAN